MDSVEAMLTQVISLLSAVAALLTAVYRLLSLYRNWYPIDDEALTELSRDVVRLEEMLQRQKAELARLKQRRQEEK